MKIGTALRQERARLGLTQDEMIQGIIHKSHYSKIERGIEGISADSLFRILFAHHIDVDEFLELTQAIKKYIKYYNNERIKNRLKGLTPIEYRNQASVS
ncbi:helix-turn-helix domain-containing protein [Lactobacillus helveticus]|nr:IS3 family transposase [Lactobacillus helveticus]MBW8013889.1 helix-turn-helix domain-containing protein [Lactobacillus helveticus]